MKNKKFKYDGKSRPTNNLYKKEFDRIFGVKEKTLSEMLDEGFEREQKELKESYEQSKRNRSERVDDE